MKTNASRVSFALGRVLITPNALARIPNADVLAAMERHSSGDWGDLDDNDKRLNDRALSGQDRIFSAYRSSAGMKFWIITEWDRSATTVLLPEDY